MNTNFQSQIPSPRTITGEGWAAIAGAIGSAFLLVKGSSARSQRASPNRSAGPTSTPRCWRRGNVSTPLILPSWRSWMPTTGNYWPPWTGRSPASMSSNSVSPAWTSAQGSSQASHSRAGVSPASRGGQARRLPYYSSQPEIILARAVSSATASPLGATRAISTNKQQKKESNE